MMTEFYPSSRIAARRTSLLGDGQFERDTMTSIDDDALGIETDTAVSP